MATARQVRELEKLVSQLRAETVVAQKPPETVAAQKPPAGAEASAEERKDFSA